MVSDELYCIALEQIKNTSFCKNEATVFQNCIRLTRNTLLNDQSSTWNPNHPLNSPPKLTQQWVA